MSCKIKGCSGRIHVKSAGLCSKHYNRLRTTGTTDDGPRARRPFMERFLSAIDKRGPDECWEFGSSKNGHGYGTISKGGRHGEILLAHRVMWELVNGPIPPRDGYHGNVVMHTCDNRGCVNPNHLELGTQGDNVRDMDRKGRRVSNPKRGPRSDRCKHGHKYNEQNPWTGNGCRLCKNESERRRRREKRGDKFGKPEYRVRTHCKHGHEFTEENTYVRPDGYKECMICRRDRVARHAARNR